MVPEISEGKNVPPEKRKIDFEGRYFLDRENFERISEAVEGAENF
jgi:hypothetical protein